jgi:hypothetical protein
LGQWHCIALSHIDMGNQGLACFSNMLSIVQNMYISNVPVGDISA